MIDLKKIDKLSSIVNTGSGFIDISLAQWYSVKGGYIEIIYPSLEREIITYDSEETLQEYINQLSSSLKLKDV